MMTMDDWFQQASPEECDAMLSLQLDYRFEGDNFGSMWWMLFRELGFSHNSGTYGLPPSSPSLSPSSSDASKKKGCTALEMYDILDSFAIPQWTSCFNNLNSTSSTAIVTNLSIDQVKWWKQLRSNLIYSRFQKEIEARSEKNQENASNRRASRRTRSNQKAAKVSETAKSRNNRKRSMADAGAELLFRKASKNKKGVAVYRDSGDPEIRFPTISEYLNFVAKENDQQHLSDIESSYFPSFSEWKFLTCTGQSLLFYGVGSKISLLQKFVDMELKQDSDVLVINGYDKTVAIDLLLQIIIRKWLGGVEPPLDNYEIHLQRQTGGQDVQAGGIMYPSFQHGDPRVVHKAIAVGKALARIVTTSLKALYLVIHSIDGIGLRNHIAQQALAALVYHSKAMPSGQNAVRLVASIDHVNGPLFLWDSVTCASFQWNWQQVHTHRPYMEEIETVSDVSQTKKNSGRSKQSNQKEELGPIRESTLAVLSSLAPRHTQSLHELAKLQLAGLATSSSDNGWVDYRHLLKKCQLNFTARSDAELRKQLDELRDQGIIESNNNKHRVPFNADGLKVILNFQK